MKLGTTSEQGRARWTDHDYPKALLRRLDPLHFTNNDVYQVLSSQLGEWSANNVCQDHSLVYIMQSFDFSIAQRGDHEIKLAIDPLGYEQPSANKGQYEFYQPILWPDRDTGSSEESSRADGKRDDERGD